MISHVRAPETRTRPLTIDPLVSIIVVNFNGRERLAACLNSLARQTYLAREIILVDNNSTDGSIDAVRGEFPNIRIVSLGTNAGFAAGCNAGIVIANGSLIATLNNDAIAEPGWL